MRQVCAAIFRLPHPYKSIDELLYSEIGNYTKDTLPEVADTYAKTYKETIIHVLNTKTSGNIKDLLRTLYLSVQLIPVV